jgi:hypothetical protein
MQARECTFRLASGRKCHAAANRNQPFCRHHAPAQAVPAPPRIPRSERYSNLIRWRSLGSRLSTMPVDEIPQEIWALLQCLIDRGPNSTGRISDLTAGRFLRALLNRLGDVPFSDPDIALASEPLDTPAHFPGAGPAAPAFAAPHGNASSAKELSALFAALGVPQLGVPYPQPSRTPVNQSRVRVNQ